eukprot:gene9853-11567_t
MEQEDAVELAQPSARSSEVSIKNFVASKVGMGGRFSSSGTADGGEHDELSSMHLQSLMSAMGHLGEDRFSRSESRGLKHDELEFTHGEAEELQTAEMAFLTDVDDSLAQEDTAQDTIKSEVQNSKVSYDIRDNAGFFARKSAKIKAVNAADLVYPKEFSPPGSANTGTSRKERTNLEAEIDNLRKAANPVSGLKAGRSGKMSQLPGGLNLNRKDTRTYFGEESRSEFFERCKWLQSQRQHTNTHTAQPTTHLVFPHSFTGSPALVTDLWEETKPNTAKGKETTGDNKRAKRDHKKGGLLSHHNDTAGATINRHISSPICSPKHAHPSGTTDSVPVKPAMTRSGTLVSLLSPVHVRAADGLVIEADPTEIENCIIKLHPVAETQQHVPPPRRGKIKHSITKSSMSSELNAVSASVRALAATLPSADHLGNRAPTNKTKSNKLALSASMIAGGSVRESAKSLVSVRSSTRSSFLEETKELYNSESSDYDEADESPIEESQASALNVTVSVVRTHPIRKCRKDDDDLAAFPFAPVRAEEDVKVRTKVIIRTQSLLDGDSYEQLKLVQKPHRLMNVSEEDTFRTDEGQYSPFFLTSGTNEGDVGGVDGVETSVSYHAMSLMAHTDASSTAHDSTAEIARSDAAHTTHNTTTKAMVLNSSVGPLSPTKASFAPVHPAAPTPAHKSNKLDVSPVRTVTSPAGTRPATTSSKTGHLIPNKRNVSLSPVPTSPVKQSTHSPDKKPVTAAVRGSSLSPYGPSKFNKPNSLLPAMKHIAHLYGPPSASHRHSNGPLLTENGNTIAGDSILNKLNATSKQMLLSLESGLHNPQDSDTTHTHTHKKAVHHENNNDHTHSAGHLHHESSHVHTPTHSTPSHSKHLLGGIVIPSASPILVVHTGHTPKSTTHKSDNCNQTQSTTSTTNKSSAQGNTASANHKPSTANKSVPLKSALKQPTPTTILTDTTTYTPFTTTHPEDGEKNTEITYMSRKEFLGPAADKLATNQKPSGIPDRYNLLQKPAESDKKAKFHAGDDFKAPTKLIPDMRKVRLQVDTQVESVLKEDNYNHFTFNKGLKQGISTYEPNLAPPKVSPQKDPLAQRFGYSVESMNIQYKEVNGVEIVVNTAVPPVQLVCVEHRDTKNNKVTAKQHKGSLFEYLESKRAGQYDFNGDISSDSEADDMLDVKRVDPASPVSPLHRLLGSLDLDNHSLGDESSVNSTEPSSINPTNTNNTHNRRSSHNTHGSSSNPNNNAQNKARGKSRGTSPTRELFQRIHNSLGHGENASVGSDGSSTRNEKRRRRRKKEKEQILPDEGDISPRSKYIDSCIRQRLNPRASLILRKNFTKHLSLQHHGIGDTMAILFAEAIVDIPYIESINIADNNLTDKGLGPLLNAVVHMKDLVDLDISYNTIGPVAANYLSAYLAEGTCPLQRLVMRRADVDDGECERFVTSLKTNKCLLELDLSENLIGTAENLNTVMPDLVTGGEALADLLRSDGCVLKSLKLGWNMIRLDGAADLCNSLKVNTTLTYLDLSFNALGSIGGIALGDALQDNKVLKTLNVASNSIDSVACLTICAGVLENEALEHVVFDGNPIGEQGAKTLMLLPTMVGSRVRISAGGCNIGIRDVNCTFDSAALVRKFELDMSNPYERAVALLVLYLVASHQTYVIGVSEYYDPETKATINLGLVEKVVVDYENKRLQKEQHEQIESLKIVQAAASDTESAMALFREIDADGSGQLDEEEFGNLVTCMGLSMSPEQVRECMSEYDVDNGGVIEMSEFSLFLRNQAKEAERKLKELTEFPIMAIRAEKEIKRYIPPRTGTLTLVVVDGFTLKDTYRVLSASDRNFINEIARQSGDLLTMTTYGVQSYKMRFNEAMGVAETLLKENSNRTEILARILPNMASAADARMLVAKLLNNNKIEVQKLRREVGFALKPMLGVMDGHYSLDLSNKMDKFCLNKLLEVGMTIAFRRANKSRLGYGLVGDCSQKGNWSSFRNEMFNGRPVSVTTDFASPMPRSGRLEFDFVSEQRVGKDDFILNDVRFTNMLVRVFQVRSEERDFVLTKLQKTRERCDRTLLGDSRTVYEVPKQRAAEIGEHMHIFYENLAKRQEQIDRYRQREGIKVNMEYDPLTTVLTYKNVNQYLTVKSLIPAPVPVVPLTPAGEPSTARRKATRRTSMADSTVSTKNIDSDGEDNDQDSKNSARTRTPSISANLKTSSNDSTSAAAASAVIKILESWDEVEALGGPAPGLIEGAILPTEEDTAVRPMSGAMAHAIDAIAQLEGGIRLDEYMRRYVCVMASSNIQPQAKAQRTVELLVNAFEYHFIYARHLELLCEIFDEYGQVPCSEFFGTYRVELVVSLYACVVDLHNFEIVMRRLTPFEAGCVICRLGWLHLYNPMKPEGAYQLDLGRREERIMVKTFAQLATAEPGDNLPSVTFRWERDMASMPGYELTEPWLTEEGLPKKGIWDVVYYAGEGKGEKGCKPMPKLRRSLLQLVFIEECDVQSEADKEAGVPPLLFGESFMMANQ